MIERKIFSGIMDTDSSPYTIGQNSHSYAKNIRFPMQGTFLQAQNVKGNYLIANSNLPGGTNEVIGSFFDQVNDVIYWFNWNQYGANGIYKLDIQTETVTQIFRCFVNSATDILNFDLNYPVHSVSLVYRTSGEGDLLYWTDGTNRPKYLNISSASITALSPFTASMLYAAKTPPLSPPTPTYASDATKDFNYVINRYFRFAYRWVYYNKEKSTFSPTSILPLYSTTNPENGMTPGFNNYIQVVVESGATADFQSIEIFGQEYNGATWGDFFLIDTINKDDVGAIPFSYTLNFYNDGIYNTITPSESDLRFDWLPNKSNCLELLNGNTIIYGGITEGYDPLQRSQVDVQITSSLITPAASGFVSPVWKWANNERLGLIYFDSLGKTNGVVSFLADTTIDTTNFNVTTPAYPGVANGGVLAQIPKLSASINHLPPSWAATYQWVRIDNAPPFFLEYITNDYQTDGNFIYLCIQGLIYNNTKNGYLPSFEFNPGDRVRVMGLVNRITGQITPFSTQLDFSILEVVERVMGGATNPAQNGSYLKCKKPAPFPTPAYDQCMMIEIYTPPKTVNDSTAIFWEWGQKYNITGGFHMGQTQNQTGSQPALFEWTNGYVYYKIRVFPALDGTNLTQGEVMNRYFNDFQESKANSNSRGWVIDENAKQQYFPVTSRWGGAYVQDTNINNLNRFYPQNLDTIDRSKGDIRRFKARDRILRVFQDRGVGQYGVYARFIQNNEGNTSLVTTDEIITTNNIQYYQGVYGLCGYPTNLVSNTNTDYFTDVVTGRAIRLSGDGMTDLGLLYKGQYYLPSLVLPYNKTLTRLNGAVAKVMGFFDQFDNQYHTFLQDSTETDPYNFSFNEDRNGFCSFYDILDAEWLTHADGVNYQWRGGYLYKQNSSVYCNFFGIQYNAEITFVFNDNLEQKKSWNSISEVASDIWNCPEIYSNVNTYPGQRQQTNLVAAEFTILESMPSSAIKRDSFSPGGKINGQFMKGNWLSIKFQKINASNLITLSELVLRNTVSPLTPA